MDTHPPAGNGTVPLAVSSANGSMKAVYTILEKPGDRSFWLRIGWAHVNRDGSYNLTLDALPVNGKLHVRDWQPRDEQGRTSRDPRDARDVREVLPSA